MIYQCGAVQYFPFLTFTIMLKANDQLRRWFEDDDALEQAMGGEYGLVFRILISFYVKYALYNPS